MAWRCSVGFGPCADISTFFHSIPHTRHTSTATQSGPLGPGKEDGRHSTAGFEPIASERNTRHSAATAASGASWDEPAVGLDLGAIRKLATLGQNFWEDIHAPGKVSLLGMLIGRTHNLVGFGLDSGSIFE